MKAALWLLHTVILAQSLAGEFLTTNLQNEGEGSLRQAIISANASSGTNTIRFSVDGTINVQAELPFILGHIIFLGRGPERTLISGENRTNSSSLFHINAGASATFQGLTIKDAVSMLPGAAIHNSGRVTLENCLITNHQAIDQGGAIYNLGQLVCLSSTICSNSVVGKRGTNIITAGGGGAFKGTGGGLHVAGGSVVMTNCTLSANVATGGRGGDNLDTDGGGGGGGGGEGSGGGIYVASGTLTLVNVTVTQNHAVGGLGGNGSGGGGFGGSGVSRGGGLFNDQGTIRLFNTIIAENSANAWIDVGRSVGGYESLGNNLVGKLATNQVGSNWWVSSDLINIPSDLEPLADYGGPTLTHRLLATSPAINAGGNLAGSAPILDQRGAIRPQGRGFDIGAVEFGKILQTLTFPPLTDKVYGDASFGVNAESSSELPVEFSVVNNLHATESSSIITITGAGLVTVEAVQPGDENYFPTTTNQIFMVKKAPLTLAVESLKRPFAQPNPTLQINYSGFQRGETNSVLDVQPEISTTANVASPVGIYPISLSGGVDNNYELQGYSVGTLTIVPAAQTLTFNTIAPKTYGDVFAPLASASSGLPVTFAVESGPAISSGSLGSTLTITDLGDVTIRATQSGNSNFLPATSVLRTFTVTKAPLVVAAVNVTVLFGSTNPALQMTYSGFKLGETTSVLDVLPKATTTATVNSSVGTYPITIAGGSDDHYILQGRSPATLTIVPQTQTIVFNPISAKTYGDIFTMSAVSQSGLPVSFSVENGPAISSGLNGSTITVTNVGVVTVKASQPGDANHSPATPTQQTFTVNKAPLTLTADNLTKTFGQPNPPFQINYSGFKLGETKSVLDTQPTSSTSATVGSSVGVYPITVTGGLDKHYIVEVSAPATLTITPATQVIEFNPIPTQTYGNVLTLSVVSSSALPVSLVVNNGPAVSSGPNGSILTITNLGIVTIRATQAGNSNFLPATPTNQTFVVNKTPLTVAAVDVDVPFGSTNPPLQMTYSGFKLGETTSVLDVLPKATTTATVNSPVGTYPITIVGGSDDHYILQGHSPATLTILPETQTIAFNPISAKTYGDIFTVSAMSQSGLPVSFSVENGPAISSGLNGSTIKVTNVGVVTIKASQRGDANHSPATPTQQTFTVNKAPLILTADNLTKTFGQPNPSFQISYSGFKLGETKSVLDTQPLVSTIATTTSPVGNYSILISAGSDDHYQVTVQNGTLAITRPNPPPTVTLVNLTNGMVYIQPIDLPLVLETLDPGSSVTKVEVWRGDVKIGSTTTTPYFVTWTNVPAGTNIIVAKATYGDGATSVSQTVRITVLKEVPFVATAVDTNSLFFRQTGLFQQTVTLTNPTPSEIAGVRLLINNLPVNARVENATGKTNGVHFIQHDLPLPPGKSVDLRVEYYVPTRAVPNPTFSTQLMSGQPSIVPTGTPLDILRALVFQNQGYLVEFETELCKTYFIQYSPDLKTWKTAWPSVTGNCAKIQWIDTGPPKTESNPILGPRRFYRIISIP